MAARGKVIAVVAGIVALFVVGIFAIKWIEVSRNSLPSIPRPAQGMWYFQVQSLLSGDLYSDLADYIVGLGYSNINKVRMFGTDEQRYILRLGPYATREDCVSELERIKGLNRQKPLAKFPRFRFEGAFPIDTANSRNSP